MAPAAPSEAPRLKGVLSFDLSKLSQIVSTTTQEVEDTPDELQAFHDYSDYLENNPRTVLRLINTHRLIKILLQRDNIFWPVKRQRKLVIWRIFCEQWPYLAKYAMAAPETDNCLRYALQKWESDDAEVPKGHRHAKVFVEHLNHPDDALTSSDIDEDFQRAKDLMDRIR